MSTVVDCVRSATLTVGVVEAMLKTQPVNGNCEHCDDAVNAVVAVSWKDASGLPSAAARAASAGGVLSFVYARDADGRVARGVDGRDLDACGRRPAGVSVNAGNVTVPSAATVPASAGDDRLGGAW